MKKPVRSVSTKDESVIQAKLIKSLEKNGYYVIKLIKTNKNGIPDLIAIPKHSDVIFIEVKRKGAQPSYVQRFRLNELITHGVKAIWTDKYKGDPSEIGWLPGENIAKLEGILNKEEDDEQLSSEEEIEEEKKE